MVKSAIGMANQVDLDSNELFLDIIRCFLDIAGRYLFSEGNSWQPLLSLFIQSAIREKAPNSWIILLLLADSFANKNNDKAVALERLNTAFDMVESDQESVDAFYVCILAIIESDFLVKVYPEWESNMALYLFVNINRYHLHSEAISAETFSVLQEHLRKFIDTNHADNLSKAIDCQSLTLKLASIALKCNLPDQSKVLLRKIAIYERKSMIFIQKEYLIAEIALFELKKTKNTDLSKISMIISALSETVDIASRSNMCAQIINEGCLLIWNCSRTFRHIPKFHKYQELIKAFKISAGALEKIASSLKSIRTEMHYELARYYYYQELIPNASDHVKKGLKLSVSNETMEMDLKLLEIMIETKSCDFLSESLEFRGNLIKHLYIFSS